MTTASDQQRAGCNWNTADGRCGQPGRLYPVGIRCDDHLPGHHIKPKQ
jgi:hypothetical protein